MYNILLPVLTTTTCINLSVDYNTSALYASMPPASIHTMELPPHLLHLLPTPCSFWTLGWNYSSDNWTLVIPDHLPLVLMVLTVNLSIVQSLQVMPDEVYPALLDAAWPSLLSVWSELHRLILRPVLRHPIKVSKPSQSHLPHLFLMVTSYIVYLSW